uniref:15-oxoprostaglandin 13-reductase n=1 Tax=Oncorhynchus mykiss TaxID=8022 RepID=A0A8C7TQ62_ONCMY
MTVSKAWTLHQHFQGFPKASDFHLREEMLLQTRDGQLEAVFLSVDPYMRPYSQAMMKVGDVMIGNKLPSKGTFKGDGGGHVDANTP